MLPQVPAHPADVDARAMQEAGKIEADGASPDVVGVDADDLGFRALAEPVRRLLLNTLFQRDGRSLGELEAAVNEQVEMTWAGWYPDSEPTPVTWELTGYPSGLTRVVLTHDVTAAPQLAEEIAGGGDPQQGGGGWLWSLSGLKTLLETGRSM